MVGLWHNFIHFVGSELFQSCPVKMLKDVKILILALSELNSKQHTNALKELKGLYW